jgi:ketosteroid isomerase-like protein
MFAGQSWRQIEGEVFDGRVRVGPLLSADREALFAAEWVGITAPEIVVRVFEASAEPVLERHMEASFLEHPNMLRCFGAGEFQRKGQRLIYAVLGRFDETLAGVLQAGPLPEEDALQLGRQLSGALAYLHHQDLVYCNLDPANITRTGRSWQLADYSQLRVAGRGYINETRRLIAVRPTTPPEAYEGVVMPSWDSWGLACVLSTALNGTRREGRSARRDLPEPFQSIVAECLSGDPHHRCGMERIRMLLDSAAMAAVPSGGVTIEQPAPLPRPGPRRPVRYLVPEADEEPAAPPRQDPPVRADAETPPEKVSFREWWEEHGLLTAAAGIGALALLVLLLMYLPRHRGEEGNTGPSQPAADVEKPTPAQPAPQPASRKAQAASSKQGEADRETGPAASDEGAIRTLIEEWTTASRARDAATQASFYAPQVERFFNARNVSQDWVRRYRQDAYKRIGAVRKFEIYNVRVDVKSARTAEATFDKTWDFSGRNRFSGNVRSQLMFRKIGNDWRIVSERDLRVYSLRGQHL